MRRAFSAFCLLLVLVMVNVLTGFPTEGGGRRAHAQGASTVLDVRVGEHGDKTRYALEMTAPLDFRIFSQTGPDRLIIEFPPLEWRVGGAEGHELRSEECRVGNKGVMCGRSLRWAKTK